MSSTDILAELPNLNADERREIYERLCELQEQDLLNGVGPTEAEKQLLDTALAEHVEDQDSGRPWREVLQQIRAGEAP